MTCKYNIAFLHFRQMLHKHEPVYQALWAGPCDFDEVLISPVMIQDHMPDNMLKALNKVSQTDPIIRQIKRSQTPVSRISSVRPGNYEILENVADDPDILKEGDKPRNIVVNVESNGHMKNGDAGSVKAGTIGNVAKTCNETIIVNAEIHEQKEK